MPVTPFRELKTVRLQAQPYEIIDVPMDAYAVVDVPPDAGLPVVPRLLSSSGYMECVGVLMCVRDAAGQPTKWALSHMTIHNDGPATVKAMAQALRGDDVSQPLEIDVFGGIEDWGDDGSFAQSGKQLAESTLAAVQALPAAEVEDSLYNPDYTSNITVDLIRGTKILGYTPGYTPMDAASILTDYYAQQAPATAAFKQHISDLTSYSQNHHSLHTPPEMPWKTLLPDYQALWNANRTSIIKDLRTHSHGRGYGME